MPLSFRKQSPWLSILIASSRTSYILKKRCDASQLTDFLFLDHKNVPLASVSSSRSEQTFIFLCFKLGVSCWSIHFAHTFQYRKSSPSYLWHCVPLCSEPRIVIHLSTCASLSPFADDSCYWLQLIVSYYIVYLQRWFPLF